MKSSQKLTLKSVALFVGLIGLSVVLFSCGNNRQNDNNNFNANQNMNGFQNCNTCQGLGGQPFFQSQSNDVNQLMTLDLNYVGSTFNNQYNNGYNQNFNNGFQPGVSPIISYSGQVAAQGQLVISQQINSFNCSIPAGTYVLQTVQAGQWSQARLSGLVLQASSGPTSITVHISQAQVAAKAANQVGQTWNEVAQVGRLFGNVEIRANNNFNCTVNTLVR